MFDDIPLLVSIAALAATVFLALTLYAWRAEIWFAWRSALRASRTPPWRLSRGIGLTVGLGLALGAGLLLGGCGTIGVGQPITPSKPIAVVIAGSGYGFDVAYHELATDTLSASPAVQRALKPILAQLLTCPTGVTAYRACTGYVAAAGLAVDAADQATLTQQLYMVSQLIGQAQAILHPGAKVAPPTVASLAAPAAVSK